MHPSESAYEEPQLEFKKCESLAELQTAIIRATEETPVAIKLQYKNPHGLHPDTMKVAMYQCGLSYSEIMPTTDAFIIKITGVSQRMLWELNKGRILGTFVDKSTGRSLWVASEPIWN